jgi:dihydroneopterin aldolase
MGKILLEGLEFYSFHGHFDEEKIVGGRFLVDVVLETNMEQASSYDKLEDALDYQNVYQVIKTAMAEKSNLLEHITARILEDLFSQFANLDYAQVKLSKMNPPLGGKIEKVSVVQEKRKSL